VNSAAATAAPSVASSHAGLCQALAIDPARAWVIDLTMGAWRPREAAHQLAAQAGIALPAIAATAPAAGASWAATVGANIDTEARGPAHVHIANADAALLHPRLCAQADAPLLVWLPLFGCLPDDNGWFLHLLGQRLQAAGSRVITAQRAAGAGAAPAAACLVPHLLPSADGGVLVHPLRGGQFLCCPSARPLDWPMPARTRFDQMAARPDAPAWLRAYAACHGNSYFVNSDALSDYGWTCHGEGATELAMLMLQRARDCARDPILHATIVARMQGLRIASQNFSDAAQEAAPPPNLPQPLRDFLRQSIGWARIMLGHTAGLDDCFGQPGSGPADSGEQLYAHNIHALGLARAGRADEALELELRIEAARSSEAIDDARLAYINNLNIARLYKRHAQLEQAARYYELAFATNYGVRTHAEAAHAAWIRASMARATGQALSAGAWLLQAVLHWLADPLPDAVPVRLAQAVLGHALPAQQERAGAMFDVLLCALSGAVERGELACGPDPGLPAPAFADMSAGRDVHHYFGSPGCSVGWSRAPLCGHHMQPGHAPLAALAARVLAACAGVPDSGGTIIVDDQGGRDLPATRTELLSLALARGAPACTWQGEHVDMHAGHEQALRRQLVLKRSIAPAALEQACEGQWQLRYLRHGRVHSLATAHAALIGQLEREGPLSVEALGGSDRTTDDTWSAAWASGAVDLILSEQACTQAGISWHTNAT
jgi:hypothetical protein